VSVGFDPQLAVLQFVMSSTPTKLVPFAASPS
jgi:hypothetical protein